MYIGHYVQNYFGVDLHCFKILLPNNKENYWKINEKNFVVVTD